MNYNEYFPGHQIAMPPPLADNAVTYADGTSATVPQMAHDIVTFLTWAAEPNLEPRHRAGFKVMLFLIITAGVFYAAKRKIWAIAHSGSWSNEAYSHDCIVTSAQAVAQEQLLRPCGLEVCRRICSKPTIDPTLSHRWPGERAG